MKKTILLASLLGAVALGVVFGAEFIGRAETSAAERKAPPAAAAAAEPAAAPASKAQDQAAAQPAADTASIFEAHAQEGKFGTCSGLFTQLGRGVVADETYTAKSQWNTKAANAHAVASLVALDGAASAPGQRSAGMVFAAPVGRSCEGTLVRVTPVKAPCQAVATELVNQNGQPGTLGDLPMVAMPNGAQVVLVPLDESCVAMTSLSLAG